MTNGGTWHKLSRLTVARLAPAQIFLRILIVLSVFESIRSNMVFSSVISRFKDIDILLLFFCVLREGGYCLNGEFFRKNAYGWLLIYVLFSLPITIYSFLTPFGAEVQSTTSLAGASYLRMAYFCFLIYALLEYFKKHSEDGVPLVKLFVFACLVFALFNIVAYFYHFPFMVRYRPQYGRFSNGYPTSDALMLVFAAIALSHIRPEKTKWDYLCLVVFVLAIIGNVTASGIAALAAICVAYICINIFRSPGRVIAIAGFAMASVGALMGAAYYFLSLYYPVLLSQFFLIGRSRWSSTQNGGGTLAVRFQQFYDQGKYMENIFDRIFGIGGKYGFIEIQFAHVYVTWGCVGLTLFMLTFFQNFLMTRRDKWDFGIYLNIVWFIGGIVLVTTYLFPLFVPFALLLSVSAANSLPGARRVGVSWG